MNITHYARTRRSTKAFDPERAVPQDKIEQLREWMRFSPSSVNSHGVLRRERPKCPRYRQALMLSARPLRPCS
ncbi:nitroreductase family protein [Paraburkholderia sp. J12]|uniref:nitroreductase family protein n=1 Tax=Paraburkholderia sp. J12 TaxID=2805432 RepID=UPI002ABD8BFF|nr:nitroreductase family protein [Paraburkholderia sp. J12]